MEMQVHRAGTVLFAPRIFHDEPNFDTFRPSKILWNKALTPCEEMAAEGLTRAEFSVLIATVVQDLLSRYLN